MARVTRNTPALVDAVESGDRRRGLEALRRKLAAELEREGLLPRDVAVLAGRLQAVMADLAALPQERKGTPLDELEERRRQREAGRAAGGLPRADVPAGESAGGRARRR